tara:strand:+ start:44 stop:316 length:273 start_codon:yes stop_codon:yes gene_type:complete
MFHRVMLVFGYILKLNKILNKVMGFTASSLNIKDQPQENQQTPLPPEHLTPQEIEILLSLIKRSTFVGEDIENLYSLVVKLQKQYLNTTK